MGWDDGRGEGEGGARVERRVRIWSTGFEFLDLVIGILAHLVPKFSFALLLNDNPNKINLSLPNNINAQCRSEL